MAKRTINMADIAKELNISRTTVSYALSNRADELKISPKTAQKIRETAKKMNYVPHLWAQNLARQKVEIVSVLLADISFGWGQDFLNGITSVLDERSFSLFLGIHMRQPKRLEQELSVSSQRRDSGVICCSPTTENITCYKEYIHNGGNLVFAEDRLEEMPNLNYVGWDVEPAVEVAIDYLIKTGRKKIGFIGSEETSWSSKERYSAFVKAMRLAGLELNFDWVGWEQPHVMPSTSIQKMMRISQRRPEVILVINDPLAIMTLDTLDSYGFKVPDDIAVISLGDMPISSMFRINLTTVHEPSEEIGREAAKMVLQMSDSKESDSVCKLVKGVDLKVRGTA